MFDVPMSLNEVQKEGAIIISCSTYDEPLAVATTGDLNTAFVVDAISNALGEASNTAIEPTKFLQRVGFHYAEAKRRAGQRVSVLVAGIGASALSRVYGIIRVVTSEEKEIHK
jgi:hypothetical protein